MQAKRFNRGRRIELARKVLSLSRNGDLGRKAPGISRAWQKLQVANRRAEEAAGKFHTDFVRQS